MTLKKLHEKIQLFSILGYPKPRLRKAIVKQGFYNECINLLSELCLNLTEGNVQLSEGVRQQINQPRSLAHALASKKKGKDFKRKRLVQAGCSFFTLLLPIIAGLVNTIIYNYL